MADASIEAQVIEFVAHWGEVEASKVLPTTRLLDDLGIDGDDAVELFTAVQERFGTDLTHLNEHWDDHFGPEGLGCGTGALMFGPAFVVGLPVAIITNPWIGFASAAVTFVATLWLVPRLGLGVDTKPITVAEIISAVEAGSWPAPKD